MYNHSSNPFNPFLNLLSKDANTCGNDQFSLTTNFQNNTTYVLVVTTYSPNVTGAFSILVSGSMSVTFSLVGKCVLNSQLP
jgi:hypothetical protein